MISFNHRFGFHNAFAFLIRMLMFSENQHKDSYHRSNNRCLSDLKSAPEQDIFMSGLALMK